MKSKFNVGDIVIIKTDVYDSFGGKFLVVGKPAIIKKVDKRILKLKIPYFADDWVREDDWNFFEDEIEKPSKKDEPKLKKELEKYMQKMVEGEI